MSYTTRHNITSQGNSRPWDHTPGYQHTSRWSGKIEHPEGEPSLFVGTLVFLGGLAVIALVLAVLS